MPRQSRPHSETGLYHIVARGNGKQNIFRDDRDRLTMIDYLEIVGKGGKLIYVAWCLMSNHVHLIVQDLNGELSKSMAALFGKYASYFNKRHKHCGHVFQDRYASFPIETEEYLVRAIHYVHANPENAGICKAANYPWSSFSEFKNRKDGICDLSWIEACTGKGSYSIDSPRCHSSGLPLNLRGEDEFSTEELLDAASFALKAKGIPESPNRLGASSKQIRAAGVEALLDLGFSIKQIGSITGIGSNILYRIGRNRR